MYIHMSSGGVELISVQMHFGQFDRSEILNRSDFSRSEIKLRRIIKVAN